jgi:hypothetical protein
LFAKQQQQQHKQQQFAYIVERLFNDNSSNCGSCAPAATLGIRMACVVDRCAYVV